MIEVLEWDSQFFGYPVGRLIINKDLVDFDLFEVLCEKANCFNLVYVYLSEGQFIEEKNCLAHNVFFVDQKIVYQKELFGGIEKINENFGKAESIIGLEDYKELSYLALLSGKYSRFKKDKNFNKREFERLYIKWLRNSINGTYADECYAIKNEKEIYQGLITCKKNNSSLHIGLIAVNPEAQGKGLGTVLIKRVEQYAKKKHIKSIMVTSQLDNIEACRFYEKSGFVKKKQYNVYHKWRIH